VSRAWRSEVSGGRVTVYAAAGLEGALVVSFFVAVQLLLNKDYFSLSAAQHGAVYAPLCAAAVLAAFFALRGSRAAARGRLFRLGLCLSAAGRVILIATVLGAVRHAAVFFPESQAGLIGRDPDAISSWALGLGAFWAALAVAARASFEAIDLRACRRRGRHHRDLSRRHRPRAAKPCRLPWHGCNASRDLHHDRHRGHRRVFDLRRPDRLPPVIPFIGRAPPAGGTAAPACAGLHCGRSATPEDSTPRTRRPAW